MQNKNGKLFIVATPIGNLADISLRALDTLKDSDLVLCEDSRITNTLLKFYNIDKPLLIYNDHSKEDLRQKILLKLQQGKNLSLVSDAGTPLISDPGYKLIQYLQQNNITIHTIPGACSVVAALTLAGIATDRFMFLGFLSHKPTAKRNTFSEVQLIQTTLIFFESSNRLIETLEIIGEYFADREIVIVREITKLYEQTVKGNFAELIQYFQENPEKLRGEIVLLISPPNKNSLVSEAQVTENLRELIQNMSIKDAVEIASKQYPLSKKIIYKLALQIKQLHNL